MAKKAKLEKKKALEPRAKKRVPANASSLESVLLKTIRLVDLNTKLEIIDHKMPSEAKIQSTATVGPTPDNASIIVDAYVFVEAHPQGEGEGSSALMLQVHYQCIFEPQGVPADSLSSIGEQLTKTGVLVMWPYFRELVHMITARMGIQPFVLPLVAAGALNVDGANYTKVDK